MHKPYARYLFFYMKKSFKILFLFVIVFTFKGFAQTADVVTGCVPLKVTFAAPSSSSTYYWDFNDGVTANIQNPINIFNKSGTFNVTFQESVNGPILKTIKIVVYPDPILNIKVASGCAPLNAEFQDASTIDTAIKVSNYTWVFDDGQSSSGPNQSTAYHSYGSLGSYSVSYNISTQYPTCDKTVIFSNAVTVYAQPIASFTTNPVNPVSCKDTINVTFTNTSSGSEALTYLWDMGNGKTYSSLNPPSQAYLQGQYNASLNVTYPANLVGCSASATIGISAGKPVAKISTFADTACVGEQYSFFSDSPGIQSWSGDGSTTITIDPVTDSAYVSFATKGTHTITLKVTSPDGACSASTSVNVFVDQVTASISETPMYECTSPAIVQYKAITNLSNSLAQYQWIFSDGSIDTIHSTVKKIYKSSTDSIYFSVNGVQFFNTTLFVTSSLTGCTAGAFEADTLWLPNARFATDITEGCAPLTVTFFDSSRANNYPIVSWKWIFGDGTSQVSTTSASVNHTYTTPGIYPAKLVITTKNGCVDTSYAINISVGAIFTSGIDFTVDKTSVCPGEPVQFSPNISTANSKLIDAYHYTTEGNRSFHCSNEQSLSWSYNYLTGPQDVSLTVEYNGCLTTVKKTGLVTVNGAIANIDFTALCSDPLNYTFNSISQNATSVTWNFGDGGSATKADTSHRYTASGDYLITLTALNASSGCAATKDTVTVHARNLKAVIKRDSLLCAGTSYSFDGSQSKDVTNSCSYGGYIWDFPNNIFPVNVNRPLNTSNPVASFSYDTSGIHSIRLIVRDINGCIDTAVATFKVFVIKPVILADKNLICIPNTVHFSQKSTGDTTLVKWSWNFGDNSPTDSTLTPVHTYTTAPVGGSAFNVALTVTDKLGCQNTSIYPITSYAPTSAIVISDNALCLGQSTTISATDFTAGGSHLSYKWNFGNGQTSTQQSQTILYTKDTIYTITLNYQEISTGCKDSTTSQVFIQTYPKAGMKTNVDSLPVLCAPQNVFFQDASVTKYPLFYSWDFGNGQTSTLPDFALFYAKGTYTAKLTVRTTYGCQDTTSRTFKVFSPEGKFTINRDTICKSEAITFNIIDTSDISSYSWAFGDGIIANNVAPVTHIYNFHPPSGQTIAKLSIIGAEGCQVQLQTPVYIHQVIANFDRVKGGTDTTICFNDGPFPFTNTSVDSVNTSNMLNQLTYLWNFGDGQTSTLANPPAHAYAKPGIYNVSLYIADNLFGCKDTIVKKAAVYTNPVTIATGDTVCQGKPAQLTVVNPSSTSTFFWTPSTNLSNVTSTNPIATNLHTAIYTVTETSMNGCADSVQVSSVIIEPSTFGNLDTTIVIGNTVQLPVLPPSLYFLKWTPDSGLANYPVIRPLQDVIYTVNVTDIRGCFNNNYIYKITVLPETFVKLPTMFVPPDGDPKKNFKVNGWGIKQLLEFQIYNRWGQLLYSSTNLDEGWDGTFNGMLQSSDIYVYKVKVLTWKNNEINQEGYFNLIR